MSNENPLSVFGQLQRAADMKRKAIRNLHIELGYASPQEFIADYMLANQDSATPLVSAKHAAVSPQVSLGASKQLPLVAKGTGKGRRVTKETRQAIAKDLKAGVVGSSLSAKYGVSYNIVHAVKTELGMVKATKRSR